MNCSDFLGPIDMISVPQLQQTTTVLTVEGGAVLRGGGGGSAELGRRLLLAARLGDTQAVLDLMAKGAPFTTDWLGTSALHVAAGNGHVHTCAVLLRAGVSRDCRTKVDRTPLHLAAHAGHAAVAELLLANHAAVDCRDMLHMTPLHWAAERGHGAVARALLARGADPLALSKFRKTPHALSAERKHHDIRIMMEDALKEREAAKSVESLRVANEAEATTEQQQALDSLDELAETAKHTNKQTSQPEPIKINIERPLEGSESGSGSAAAAAMLRRHGITLLPTDSGSTVLSALQSGRSVVLSDAGKLMLKESSEVPQTGKSSPLPASVPAAPSKGVLLTATPVKSPPNKGVKIFTLNNKLLAMPKENKAPVKKIINPHDSSQIQYINLTSDAKMTATRTVSMKAKNKLTSLPGAAGVAGGSPVRPTVKLIMQKSQLNKLTGNAAERSAEDADGTESGNVLFVPEEFLTNSSPSYLRTQLLSAHKTIASLNAQLSACKQRLHNYENI